MRVKRAIILAAGKGTRLAPVTDELPKPLVRVNGRRIIETQLDAALAAGISEIYIVRGYLGGCFDVLKDKYPMLRFVDNPFYDEANNISSVVCAGELVKNAYVIEGDLFVADSSLILPEQERSNYVTIPVKETDDWCFFANSQGKIERMAIGGQDCDKMVGISYWTEADGERLAEHARELFAKEYGKQKYWDEIALDEYLGAYDIYVRRCKESAVTEIDTFAELCELDKSYENWGK